METLHNWFLAQAQEALQPERIISQILIQHIKQSGITLNADQETAIVQQLQANGVSDRFTLTLTDEQEQEAIKKGIDPNNIRINLNDFQVDPNILDDIFTNVADIISTTLVKSWIEHAPEVLREQEEERKRFEAHLVKSGNVRSNSLMH